MTRPTTAPASRANASCDRSGCPTRKAKGPDDDQEDLDGRGCNRRARDARARRLAGSTPPGGNGQIVFRRYVDNKNTSALFVINPDGSGNASSPAPRPASPTTTPLRAPDGSRVVFERCGKNRCATATIAADGSDLRPLGRPCRHGATPTPKCDERGAPAWSPDGKWIVFNRAYGPIKQNTIKYSGLAVADPTGAHLRNLVISKPYVRRPARRRLGARRQAPRAHRQPTATAPSPRRASRCSSSTQTEPAFTG